MFGRHVMVCVGACCWLSAGCGSDDPYEDNANGYGPGNYGNDHTTIEFRNDLNSNSSQEVGIRDLKFVDADGKQVSLSDHIGEKNLVVVITRGNPGEICVYCSTQVSRLIANYKKVTEQNGQVVVIYPVADQSDSAGLTELLQSAKEKLNDPSTKLPFPALLDVELNVVKQLGIERDLSAPATYIVDTSGNVKFAYVGQTAADRPSVNEIIRQLKEINKTGATNL